MIIGASRVKNEARWIDRMIRSIQPLCDQIIILDDYSSDDTVSIAEGMGCHVIHSPFATMDESRDKNYLLDHIYSCLPDGECELGDSSPHWAIMLDGDEAIVAADMELLKSRMAQTPMRAISIQILYLWDDEQHIRTDGIYSRFYRPSIYRLISQRDRFRATGHGPNLHCSSAPGACLSMVERSAVRALHYGYLHREDRVRKFEFYNRIDPHNPLEDGYRHMVIGDIFPANARFRHGGPIQLEEIAI